MEKLEPLCAARGNGGRCRQLCGRLRRFRQKTESGRSATVPSEPPGCAPRAWKQPGRPAEGAAQRRLVHTSDGTSPSPTVEGRALPHGMTPGGCQRPGPAGVRLGSRRAARPWAGGRGPSSPSAGTLSVWPQEERLDTHDHTDLRRPNRGPEGGQVRCAMSVATVFRLNNKAKRIPLRGREGQMR